MGTTDDADCADAEAFAEYRPVTDSVSNLRPHFRI